MKANEIKAKIVDMLTQAPAGSATVNKALKELGVARTTGRRAVESLLKEGVIVKDGKTLSRAPSASSEVPQEGAKPAPESKSEQRPTPKGTKRGDDGRLLDESTGEELDEETGEPVKEKKVKKSKSKKAKVTKAKSTKVRVTKRVDESGNRLYSNMLQKVVIGKETLQVKIDGKRTSEPGALADFRERLLRAGEKGATLDRTKVLDHAVKAFGPKAKWATQNYIALAKRGKLTNAYTLTEDDEGTLTPGDWVPGKGGEDE